MFRELKVKDLLKWGFILICIGFGIFAYKGSYLKEFFCVVFGVVCAISLIYGLMSLCSYMYYRLEIQDGKYERVTAHPIGFTVIGGLLNNGVPKKEIHWGFSFNGKNYHPHIKNSYLIDKHKLKFDMNSTTEFYYNPLAPEETIWCIEVEDALNSVFSSLSFFIPFLVGLLVLILV